MAYASAGASIGYVSLSGDNGERSRSARSRAIAISSMILISFPSLHQEILHQAVERRSMFDLCPVATVPKDVELDILQRMQQFLAGRKRDHAVVPPVYDEGRRMYFTETILVSGQVIHPLMSRCGEHAGECLLHPGPDTRLVAQLSQLVGDELAVIGEDVQKSSHVGNAGR